jgi:hypothetical protein
VLDDPLGGAGGAKAGVGQRPTNAADMQSSCGPVGPDAPTLTQGAEAWGRLCERLAQRARLDAEIVELTGVVARSGTIEQLEGVGLDTALNLVHRLPSADRSMQLTAADVLADMPATTGLFRAGELSWGQVRGIVTEARRLGRDQRAALDARIGAVGMLLTGVDTAAPPDDGRSLSQRRADGLLALATHRCDADTGTITIDAPGCLPTLTARAVEALAADATVQVVLVDGARPLAATRKVWAKTIPADVRHAVLLRDGGDRFPGSRRRANHIHHLDKRRRGHHPDALLGLADVSHQRVHRNDWAITLHPRTGEATFTRAGRQWTTLPRHTRLRRPPPQAATTRTPTRSTRGC